MIKYTVPPKGYESWAEFAHKVGIHKLKTALLSPQDFIRFQIHDDSKTIAGITEYTFKKSELLESMLFTIAYPNAEMESYTSVYKRLMHKGVDLTGCDVTFCRYGRTDDGLQTYSAEVMSVRKLLEHVVKEQINLPINPTKEDFLKYGKSNS